MNVWFALSKPDKGLWVKTHGIEHPVAFKEFLKTYEASMAEEIANTRKGGKGVGTKSNPRSGKRSIK